MEENRHMVIVMVVDGNPVEEEKWINDVMNTNTNFYTTNYEIILVNFGKNNPGVDLLCNNLANAPGIWMKNVDCRAEENYVAAVSKGINFAKSFGHYITFLDRHVVPNAGWLFQVLQAMEEDLNISACGIKLVKDSKVVTTGILNEVNSISYPYRHENADSIPKRLVEDRLSVPSSCITFRSDKIKELKGNNLEEAILNFCISEIKEGNRICYVPMVSVETTNDIEEPHLGLSILPDVKRNPKVGIILPIYNAEKYISETLERIKNQTYKNWKLFILDDASTDNSLNVIEDNIKDIRNKVDLSVNVKNSGVSYTRNRIIEMIKADSSIEFVAYCDSDDLWYSNHLEDCIIEFINHPETDFVWADVDPFFSDGSPAYSYGIPYHVELNADILSRENSIYVSTVVHRVKCLEIGEFDAELNSIEDWDYWCRIAEAGYNMHHICLPHSIYIVKLDSPGNASNLSKDQRVKFQLKRKSKHHQLSQLDYQTIYGNNCERYVGDRNSPIPPRETLRYSWAAQNLLGPKVLEIGCSSGYGLRLLPKNIDYLGIDYDSYIITFAREQFGDLGKFEVADINNYEFGQYDTIIAFEVIEHLDKGLEIVEKLKNHCKRLLVTTPYNETPGQWGIHHKLHHIVESHYKDFEIYYLDEYGIYKDPPGKDGCLIIARWDSLPEGWFSSTDIDTYRSFVDGMPDNGVMCELGVWKGKSICCAADIIKRKNLKVYAIDTFEGTAFSEQESVYSKEAQENDIEKVFKDNLVRFGLENNVTVIRSLTTEAVNKFPDNHFDYIFDDAGHEHDVVKADLSDWYPKLKPGGLMAGHDWHYASGVKQAVSERFENVETDMNNIWYVRKKVEHPVLIEGVIMKSGITATLSTKNRYDVMQHALVSLALQSLPLDRIIIFDDNDKPTDLREHDTYKNIFGMLDDRKIKWEVIFGKKKGQVANHQQALDIVKTDFIFRCDDDHILQHDVLEKLYNAITSDDNVGAVGGLVYHPGRTTNRPAFASNKIDDIFNGANIQWYKQPEHIEEVDHLYSTFLFRKEAAKHGYDLNLSRIGHREETIFTYTMKRKGWKLLVDTSAITWHFQAQGGIRSFDKNREFWEHDEQIFQGYLQEWGISPTRVKLAVLDAGLGDHCAFKQVLPEIIQKYHDHQIILSICYPEVFEEYLNDVRIISIAEANHFGADKDKFNIYRYLWEQHDQGHRMHLVDAYREMYGV